MEKETSENYKTEKNTIDLLFYYLTNELTSYLPNFVDHAVIVNSTLILSCTKEIDLALKTTPYVNNPLEMEYNFLFVSLFP